MGCVSSKAATLTAADVADFVETSVISGVVVDLVPSARLSARDARYEEAACSTTDPCSCLGEDTFLQVLHAAVALDHPNRVLKLVQTVSLQWRIAARQLAAELRAQGRAPPRPGCFSLHRRVESMHVDYLVMMEIELRADGVARIRERVQESIHPYEEDELGRVGLSNSTRTHEHLRHVSVRDEHLLRFEEPSMLADVLCSAAPFECRLELDEAGREPRRLGLSDTQLALMGRAHPNALEGALSLLVRDLSSSWHDPVWFVEKWDSRFGALFRPGTHHAAEGDGGEEIDPSTDLSWASQWKGWGWD